ATYGSIGMPREALLDLLRLREELGADDPELACDLIALHQQMVVEYGSLPDLDAARKTLDAVLAEHPRHGRAHALAGINQRLRADRAMADWYEDFLGQIPPERRGETAALLDGIVFGIDGPERTDERIAELVTLAEEDLKGSGARLEDLVRRSRAMIEE